MWPEQAAGLAPAAMPAAAAIMPKPPGSKPEKPEE